METDVFQYGQIRIEPETLAHIADSAAYRLKVVTGAAQHPGRSGAGIQNAGQHPQRSGLAGTVRTHQPEQLSFRDGQAQIINGGQLAESLGKV